MPDNRERFDNIDEEFGEVLAAGGEEEASLASRGLQLAARFVHGAKEIIAIVRQGDPGEMVRASTRHLS